MGDMSEHIEWANPCGGYENHLDGNCGEDCRFCYEEDEDLMDLRARLKLEERDVK